MTIQQEVEFSLGKLIYNIPVALSRNGGNMYIENEEIGNELWELEIYSKELVKYFRKIQPKKYYDALLDDLLCFTLCFEEDILDIKQYIFDLETQLYLLKNEDE